MKVVQANKAYLPHLGGVETIVRQISEGVAAQPDLESVVIACSDARQTTHATINGVQVTYVGTLSRAKSLPVSPAFTHHLLEQRADVLITHEPFLLPGISYLTRQRKMRHRFRHLVLWWHSDIVRQRTLRRVYEPLQRALLQEASAIIVATPHHITSSEVLPQYRDKCRVIPFGIDPSRFEMTQAIQQRVADIKTQFPGPLILFSGRLVYYKGAKYLVEAMQKVPEAHLIMVGNGPLQEELQKLAEAGRGNVTFMPPVSDNELNALYHACDVFVLPSVENSEAFGIVQIEAMACGKPVICCDLPTGVTYVNRNNETGLVVPRRDPEALANAIKLLVENEELRGRLGNRARERVLQEFTVNQMVESLITMCKGLPYGHR